MKRFMLSLCTGLCFAFNSWGADCSDGALSCGTTDDGLSWEISEITDENNHIIKQLTISGSGAMKDYTRSGNDIAPWRNPDNAGGGVGDKSRISKVVIEDGVTSIGDHAFEDMYSVSSVSLPEGLKSIGKEAFLATETSEINIPNSVEELEPYAFYATRTTSLVLPENLKTIGKYALYSTYLSNVTIPENTVIDARAFESEGGDVYVQNVYCSSENKSCQAIKNRASMNGKVQFYESDGDSYFFDNKWYANVQDIGTPNYIKKRIYTIDEALKVSKPTGNRFRIRYR